MRLVWATDIHLNFVRDAEVTRFVERVAATEPDAVLLGGDIGEAVDLVGYMEMFADQLQRPIYFVLGNHDYYGSDVQTVRACAQALDSRWLHWLPATGVVRLTPDTALVGHGGWGDARAGDFGGSDIVLSDYLLIGDLRDAAPGHGKDPTAILNDRPALRRVLQALGDDAAASLAPIIADAVRTNTRVIVLTHVPPVAEACWHEGQTSHPHWLPLFTCQAIGDVLRAVAAAHPSCQVTVLCGHTHGAGQARVLPNLLTYTRGATYGHPSFLVLDLDEPDFGLGRADWTDGADRADRDQK